jgi:hypothetical protein
VQMSLGHGAHFLCALSHLRVFCRLRVSVICLSCSAGVFCAWQHFRYGVCFFLACLQIGIIRLRIACQCHYGLRAPQLVMFLPA